MKKVTLLSMLLSASIMLNPLGSITVSAEDSSYSFNIRFVTEESEEFVEDVNAKLIQQAIEWTDDEHYTVIGDADIVCAWNTSDANPFITETLTDNWQNCIYTIVVDELPDGYVFNGGKRVESCISGYLDGEVEVSVKLKEGEPAESTTPLNGTYSLALSVKDIVSNEKISGLDCELYNMQSGEVVAAWNTSETEELYVENLQYSFDKPDSYNGNITYAIRITNLPENYRFFYGKSREYYGISGFGLEEFANGSELNCVAYLEDTSEDAPKYTYVTGIEGRATTATTTITTDIAGQTTDDSSELVTTSTLSETETQTTVTTTTTDSQDLSNIPLNGTYSLKLTVMDIVRNKKVAGLDCELFNLQSGEVVAAWNTSETEEMYVENLQYSFDKPDSLTGSITYAIRITNLPENYCFFYGKSREFYGISGFGLEEFANGSELNCVAYLEDTSEDAPKYTYVTNPQDSTTTETTAATSATESGDLSSIPLNGTYSLKLTVMDIVREEKVAGLDCELFNMQSGEVVVRWNTSETEEMSVEKLQYSFDNADSYNGNITYAIRITNLPENYRFFYGKNRDQYGVSGFGLEEFADGTDLSVTVYLEDTSDDAPKYTYVTDPQDTTTTTTTTSTDTTGDTLPQTGYTGPYKVILGFAALMSISGAALIVRSRKEDE